jgi:parvulin-like peptidyl-prolyl isomerase
MAMMARMRSLAPAFIIGVGGLFVLFMVMSDSKVMEVFGARSNNIGSVNGKDITYQQFATLLDRATQNQKAQTGQDIPEENMEQFRDQVWDAYVTQLLTEQELNKFGITVTDDEVREVILGENPPDFLKKSFIDSTGKFNREAYQQAIFDPRNKEALIQAESMVREQLLNQKLQSFLLASITVSEEEIRRKFIDQNVGMTAEFAMIDINSIENKDVIANDEEIKNYYNEHPDKFKQEAQRKIKYVLFKIASSASDTNAVIEHLNNVFEKIKNDTGFVANVDIYSEVPYSRDTIAINGLPQSVQDAIGTITPGTIFGPLPIPGAYAIYRLVSVIPSKDTYVRASHILIQTTNDDAKDKAEADRVYDQLKNGADFSTLAKTVSKDPGSSVRGGDLRWFGRGQMVKEFDDAAFKGDINVIQKPVKTSYGYHIIKVTGKSDKKYVLEKIQCAIKVSAVTKDEIYNQANDFSYLADKNGFEKEADFAKYDIVESQPIPEKSQLVPGLGINKALVDFVYDNGLNKVSQVYKVQNGYVVFKISDIVKAGVKKLDEVKLEVRADVMQEKKFKVAYKYILDIKNKIGNDLSKAVGLFPNIRYDTTGIFTTAGNIPKVGVEYNFSANALNFPLNVVSGPVKGGRGYYLIKVIKRNDFDANLYNMQRNTLRDNILTEKKQVFLNQWLRNLKDDADIVDKRSNFYNR